MSTPPVGSAKLALKLGADKYHATLKSFGFGGRTGVGFPGEISGMMPQRKDWSPLSLANIGFGQGILVTPIQMMRAYAAFANGGLLVQPSILKTYLRDDEAEQPAPETHKRILPEKVAVAVTEALAAVTEDKGTGMKARLDGYVVAGKTGTAQTVDPNTGKYSRSRYIASFIGFPVGVEPRLVIYTAVDSPRGVYYASETAAPLFRGILAAAVNRYSIPATVAPPVLAKKDGKNGELTDRLNTSLAKVTAPNVTTQGPVLERVPATTEGPAATDQTANAGKADAVSGAGASEGDAEAALRWDGSTPDGSPLWKMPDLRGLTAREAIQVLKGHRFKLEVHGAGVVKSQLPQEGKTLAEGDLVKLNLGDL